MPAPNLENTIRAALASQAGVRMLILFGSLATGRENPESDTDLAIDAGRTLDAESKMALVGKLAEFTGRPVDLIDLRTVGEPLLGQILKYGKRLAGDDAVYAELIKRHVFEEADFMPYYRRILGERRNAWIAK